MDKKIDLYFRKKIKEYYKMYLRPKKFEIGSLVPVSGKVFDQDELVYGVEAVLDGWWTEGRFAKEFEKLFAREIKARYVTLTNSGSSANLIALSALTSVSLGESRLKAGDEVITVATGFPTTVNPILQNNCIPVFIDNDLYTKNASVEGIKKALTKKTRAIMIAHGLGNPLPLKGIMEIVNTYKLWFIEDSCDALGATYEGKPIGSFGHISTFSFYPAHQITMGEGGAAVTSNPLLHRALRQFRDWGRDCWCDTGCDNTCRKRFGWKLGELPYGYDHKYTYTQIGYNLKLTDMQAAIGIAQLKKLPKFIKKRKSNFDKLHNFFSKYPKYFTLTSPEKESNPSWFGFMIVVCKGAPFTKEELVDFLEKHKIVTRGLFGGNLVHQPGYLKHKDKIKISGRLINSDIIMNSGFWIGVYPGLTMAHLSYVIKCMNTFLKQYK